LEVEIEFLNTTST